MKEIFIQRHKPLWIVCSAAVRVLYLSWVNKSIIYLPTVPETYNVVSLALFSKYQNHVAGWLGSQTDE